MRWIYRIAALGLLPFGLYAVNDDFPRLWTQAGETSPVTGLGTLVGFAIILPGVLNLLNDQYGGRAWGLRVTTVVVNVLLTLVFLRLELISRGMGMFLLLPGLFLVCSAYSVVILARGESRGGGGEETGAVPAGAGEVAGRHQAVGEGGNVGETAR